jgi:hypothetical protein
LIVLEEPSVPLRPAPRFLPVNIALAVALGLALGGLGVYIANARDTILKRQQLLPTNGMVMGQLTQEAHLSGNSQYSVPQADSNGSGDSAL